MPVKRLPKKLVERLQSSAPAIERLLGRMKKIDYRKLEPGLEPTDVRYAGGRVRAMNVSKHFPKIKEVVVKRVHDATAQETIDHVRKLIRWHNKTFKEGGYKVVEPKAYAVGKQLVAMAKTDCPTVAEILWHKSSGGTEKGKMFFKKLKEKCNVNEAQLRTAAELLFSRTRMRDRKEIKRRSRRGIAYKDLVLLGIKKGEFVFMPWVDLF